MNSTSAYLFLRNKMSKRLTPKQGQSGAVLFLGVVFLSIASILAISSIRTSTTQERITSNHINKTNSLIAAEFGLSAALNFGTTWIAANTSGTIPQFITAFNTQFGSGSWQSVTSDPQSIITRYRVEIVNDNGINFIQSTGITSDGQSTPTIFAQTILRARFSIAPGNTGNIPTAPAAISCFGTGPCTLNPGASANVVMSGRNHPLPPANCTGSACNTIPPTPGTHVPAVFTDSRSDLNLISGNPASRRPFIGTDRTSPTNFTDGRVANDNSVWDATNFTTPPVAADFFNPVSHVNAANRAQFATFGVPTQPAITFMDASTTFNYPNGNTNNAGILVIDGRTVVRNGTGTFRGLIIIRNCGRFDAGGTFQIYGAVLVDTSGCPANYDPFNGNGTPSVRFSSAGVDIGNNLLTGPAVFTANEWFEL